MDREALQCVFASDVSQVAPLRTVKKKAVEEEEVSSGVPQVFNCLQSWASLFAQLGRGLGWKQSHFTFRQD